MVVMVIRVKSGNEIFKGRISFEELFVKLDIVGFGYIIFVLY